MVSSFHIKVNRRSFRFESVTDMEDFISKNKDYVKNSVIILKDEKQNTIGFIKVLSYLKFNSDAKGT